jgi:hypothetical protein
MTNKNPSARLCRWVTRLEQYTLRFEYRKGKLHGIADALSRWPLPDKDENGTEDFNDIIINTIIMETESSLMRVEQKLVTNSNQFIEFKEQFIGFRTINEEHIQATDDNIQFIINKLSKSQARPDHTQIKNAEQIYVKEWNNLLIDQNVSLEKSKRSNWKRFCSTSGTSSTAKLNHGSHAFTPIKWSSHDGKNIWKNYCSLF